MHPVDKKSVVFLVGFMGAGKTFLGKQLAQLLTCEFIDLDEFIERNEGNSIAGIFNSKGEEYFRRKESSTLRSLAGDNKSVIATGGGTPCFHGNMQWMNERGITVYLKMSPETLLQRLKPEISERPLLAGKTEEEVRSFIISKLQARESFYQQAAIIIDGESVSPQSLVKMLTDRLS